MRAVRRALAAALGAAVLGVAPLAAAHAQPAASASAALRSSSGKHIGWVTFRDTSSGVQVRVEARWVKPGFHGLHLHTTGRCEKLSTDPKDASKRGAFLSAGGHWTKGKESHPDHSGDLPVVYVTKDTRVATTFVTDRFRVADLFDADGTAVVLHQGVDNFANVPPRYAPKGPDAETRKAGDSGTRAACGVVRR